MRKFFPLLLASAVALGHSAVAQNATTTPVGAMTYTFNATSTSKTTYISFPLNPDPVFTGKPIAVGNETLTFNGTNWTNGQFASTPPSYIVRILTGPQAGRTLQVLGNTATTLTLSTNDRSSQTTNLNASGFSVSTSDSIEIIACDTIASLFGDNSVENPLIFVGNTSVFTADTVGVFNRATAKWETYYFSTSPGQNYWRSQAINTNRNTLPIYPDDAIIITRRASRPASTLTLTGRVPTVTPLLKANPNASYATSLMVPTDVTLAQLNLTGAFSKGTSVFTADTVSILDASSGKFLSYYQRSADNTWRRETGTSDVSSTLIPAGSVIFVRERATNLTGSSSFNSISLPYSL